MTTTFTKNLRLPKPDFSSEPWSQQLLDMADAIDTALFNVLADTNLIPWVGSTLYFPGQIRLDTTSGTSWLCTTQHTSAASNFGLDRTNNPTFWTAVSLSLRVRGQWTQNNIYQAGDIVYDVTGGRSIFAYSLDQHISSLAGNITTDAAHWIFIFNGAIFTTAAAVTYDHSVSLLSATQVQAAIDEVVVNINNRVRYDAAQSLSGGQKAQVYANLGLGTAATFDVGTTANKVVQLTGAAKLPAVDGSLLTNVIASQSVQQGTGVGQFSNVIKIGWDNVSKIKVTVDVTDEGAIYTTGTIGAISGGGVINFQRADGAWTIPPGSLISYNAYTGSQTITIPAGATKALVKMSGSTGGSGGINANGTGAATGGTGGAAYLEKYLTGLTPGNTLAYTEGAGGAAGTSGGGNAGNGTASTLASGTQSISTLTAGASNGSLGNGTQNTTTSGTAGGTASGGDENINGLNGFPPAAQVISTLSVTGGWGHRTPGAHGLVTTTASTIGNAGRNGNLTIEWFA